MLKRVPGTKDILPEEIDWWQKTEATSRRFFSFYNYQEIRPPLIEEASLFNRSLGESTEIVKKQMFLFKNGPDIYALRPEGTASIVRAYLENNLYKTSAFVKFYYIGPMFRRERPQKGRLRQFYHLGCEALGSSLADIDVEVISLADKLLQAYSISGYKIKVNSLGCLKDKKELIKILHHALKGRVNKLCPDCKLRYKRNILRILDCKNEGCQRIIQELKLGNGYLCPECKAHFAQVKAGLDILKIDYEIWPYLVRGLDYYTRTVFEIKHQDLDSQQDALGAGGRYDNLVIDLGGPQTGAIGFAFGMERLLLVSKPQAKTGLTNLVYIISLGQEAGLLALRLLDKLRNSGIASDTDYEEKSLKGAMRKANDLGARYVLIVGEDEIKERVVSLKDMEKGEQEKVPLEEIVSKLLTKLVSS